MATITGGYKVVAAAAPILKYTVAKPNVPGGVFTLRTVKHQFWG